MSKFIFQANYFPSNFGQSVSEDSLPEKMCSAIQYTVILKVLITLIEGQWEKKLNDAQMDNWLAIP